MTRGSGNFVTGLFIGLVAGSVIALLSAPQSGQETRHKISEKTTEFKDRANDTIDDVLIQAEEAVGQARHMTAKTIERARERINTLQGQGNKMVDEQKARLDRLSRETSRESGSEA